jgi:Protein of unknown function (DUF3237)
VIELELRHLVDIVIEVEPPDLLGTFPEGERRLIRFASGTFEGADGLRGEVAAGGLDWQVVRPDGVIELEAHYWLRTDDGDAIEVRSDGIRVAAPEVAARIAAGEPVDPGDYYFRTHIRLGTSSGRYDRLNRVLALAWGERKQSTVHIHVHEVL